MIPSGQQILMPNNQQQQRRHQHQQLPYVGHFRQLRQRGRMQIHQSAEIDVSIANMLHKHQHCFHYKIDVSLGNDHLT